MQNVLSALVKHLLTEMKGFVPLNVVLNKIIVDHAKAEFKEFRDTILGMLDTYRYEERILQTANNLLQEDVQQRVKVLHKVSDAGFSC
jgi:vacuolar protein sorting-associated protein 8